MTGGCGGLQHGELTEKIIGVFYDVYHELGYGFLESVYEESLVISLREAGLRFERQLAIPVWFRGHQVGQFRGDILVEGKVLLELKSTRTIEAAHQAQLLPLSEVHRIAVGMMRNFGSRPQFRRLLFDDQRKEDL